MKFVDVMTGPIKSQYQYDAKETLQVLDAIRVLWLLFSDFLSGMYRPFRPIYMIIH